MTDECVLRLSSHSDHNDYATVVSVAIGNVSSDVSQPRELAELPQFQCASNILNDIVLPKFHDSRKQNVVQLLAKLDDYYSLKRVPETRKLPIAMKKISDSYSKQWFTAVYQDLTSYGQFKRVFTELLWSPEIQSQVRSQLYIDRFDINSNESVLSHFLKYSVLAANLSP
jgi:hypothetical protein